MGWRDDAGPSQIEQYPGIQPDNDGINDLGFIINN